MTRVKVCGECADRLCRENGGAIVTSEGAIALGDACEGHPGGARIQATRVVEGDELPAAEAASALVFEPEIGPVTEIVLRLLTARDRSSTIGRLDVERAVETAHLILSVTGGR